MVLMNFIKTLSLFNCKETIYLFNIYKQNHTKNTIRKEQKIRSMKYSGQFKTIIQLQTQESPYNLERFHIYQIRLPFYHLH